MPEDGVVRWFDPTRGYGSIARKDGPDVFVHRDNITTTPQLLLEGDRVAFDVVTRPNGPHAKNVMKAVVEVANYQPPPAVESPRQTETGSTTIFSRIFARAVPTAARQHVTESQPRKTILDEVANWKLEAKLEDNRRYFYNTADVSLLNSGAKCFIIGRKGTGKTAIREHLTQLKAPKRFSEKLTFKNFPFNELYSHANNKYTAPNQYITLWKWIIYCHIAKQMIRNEAIDSRVRAQLAKAFPQETVQTLARSVTRLISPEFSVSVFGIEVTASAQRGSATNETPFIERCDFIEQFIADNIDDATYLVVFDELDDDYRDIDRIERRDEYVALMTSLFKAVQDIRSLFTAPRYHIQPMIFLRDDIYDILRDSDKTKWNDSKIELKWSRDELRNVLAFRVVRAADPFANRHDPSYAFPLLFRKTRVTEDSAVGEPYSQTPFEYMLARSLQRPRDLISFSQIGAQTAMQRQRPHVSVDVLKSADKPYSTYLRNDLEDEIGAVMPDIRAVVDILAAIRSPNFEVAKFADHYKLAVRAGKVADRDPIRVLETLFQFSVIGNNVKGGGAVFHYFSPGAQFNPAEQVRVLHGLLATLNIPWK
jgi:cold shock CspA family protein